MEAPPNPQSSSQFLLCCSPFFFGGAWEFPQSSAAPASCTSTARSRASTSPRGDSVSTYYPYQLKRNHGALAMFGWGVLLPLGAIVARYLRHKDPLWYYIHVLLQFLGYITGLAGVVAGIALYNRIHSNFTMHRGLGISVLALGSLQVIAFFLHPNKDSQNRKYWNRYHHWLGRLCLLLAAVNIVLGIEIGGNISWKVIYGAIISVILITVTFLEIMMWTTLPKEGTSTPGLQMPTHHFES